uniref:Uncharacterized protein n=1 Tax=Romanomermis culicivorax TaxID=13658 RepID=A0A915IRJ8_ROMCU
MAIPDCNLAIAPAIDDDLCLLLEQPTSGQPLNKKKIRRNITRAIYTPERRWTERTNFVGQVLSSRLGSSRCVESIQGYHISPITNVSDDDQRWIWGCSHGLQLLLFEDRVGTRSHFQKGIEALAQRK